MAIETASYISDLVSANPPGTDALGQADDHIRLIKGVLKNTFPNINAACNATPLQLNGYFVPQGAIIMWSGSSAPTGWALCDGGTYSKSDGSGTVVTPNLANRFIVASGSSYPLGTTGGVSSVTPTITMSNAPFTLTSNELPAHTHVATVTDAGHNHTTTDSGHTHSYTAGGSVTQFVQGGSYSLAASSPASASTTGSATTGVTVNTNTTGISVTNASTGTGASHTHANSATSSSVSTISPYYSLAFIMKL